MRPRAILARIALLAVGAGAALSGCGPRDSQAFQCGVPLESDEDIIRYCAGVHEVCICETNYCATRDESCAQSGYRYLEPPFGPSAGDGDEDRLCVARDPGAWIVPTGSNDACPARPDEEQDAGQGGKQ